MMTAMSPCAMSPLPANGKISIAANGNDYEHQKRPKRHQRLLGHGDHQHELGSRCVCVSSSGYVFYFNFSSTYDCLQLDYVHNITDSHQYKHRDHQHKPGARDVDTCRAPLTGMFFYAFLYVFFVLLIIIYS